MASGYSSCEPDGRRPVTHRTAFVVVSYGSHALLAENLASTAAGTDALVVVVDSWSGHAERAAVERLTAERGWELVAMTRNEGFGAGVDAGAARAIELGADVLLLLNPDLALSPAGAAELAADARREPTTMLAPRIVRPDGREWFTGGTIDLRTGRTRATGAPASPDWLSGACLALSVDLWRRAGGFDEGYVLYWEDVDLSRRVLDAGGRLRVRTDLTAVHDAGGTQTTAGTRAKSPVYYRFTCRGRLVFAATHLDRRMALRWVLSSPAYAREVVLRGGRRQLLNSPMPVVAAVRGTIEGTAEARRRLRARRPGRPVGAPTGPAVAAGPARDRLLVVAHPSPDLYGSDRQLLETVEGVREAGWRVEVHLPAPGPLVELLEAAGAGVQVTPFPVLRKSLLHPVRLVGHAIDSARAVLRIRRLLRRDRPDLLLVNTVTIPTWLAAARLARTRSLCHVHEAEESGPRAVAAALAAPLLLADAVVANSAASRRALARAVPRLGRRVEVVHNGVQGPPQAPAARTHEAGGPWHLVLVGRLSPRKGTDVALEALASLVADGHDVRLSVCGTVFPGYEWFEEQLRERAARDDLAGRVELLGYVHPTWDVVAGADVVLVPSRVEPFGNTAAEGMLARRPVVASRTQGLVEVVDDGRTGLLAEPGDAASLAAAVARLLLDDGLRTGLAEAGLAEARERFTTARYRTRIAATVERAAAGRGPLG
jgi:glycosyltransferase involved in cell wall biosynthesis/GT2 family glycosyltransferase